MEAIALGSSDLEFGGAKRVKTPMVERGDRLRMQKS